MCRMKWCISGYETVLPLPVRLDFSVIITTISIRSFLLKKETLSLPKENITFSNLLIWHYRKKEISRSFGQLHTYKYIFVCCFYCAYEIST